jgi:succinate dehydrogenase/fumarate reductase flavoprotein subunit
MDTIGTETRALETDVLIIGGGAAGLWAAIRARDFGARVLVVDKGKVARSGASVHTHCILAPVPEEGMSQALEEIVVEGGYMCNQKWAERLLWEQGDRIRELASWGAPFRKDASGNIYTAKDRKQVVNNSIYLLGSQMMEKMKAHALSKGVEFLERVVVAELLTSDGQLPTGGSVVGAVGFHTRTGEFYIFKAKAVIISTSLISAELYNAAVNNCNGDGHAMAFRAGAKLSGLEFGQVPNFPLVNRKVSTGHPAVFQLYGAKLVNSLGEEFVEKYYPGKTLQLLSRAEISYAVAKEALEGRGPIFFDMRHWSDDLIEEWRRILPSMMSRLDDAGIDLKRDRLETMPRIGTWGGAAQSGIRVDDSAESSIPGLFAAGVAAHIPVNIIDMTGLTQAVCYVSGCRAGEVAGKRVSATEHVSPDVDQVNRLHQKVFSPLLRERGLHYEDIYISIGRVTVPAEFSFFKHEERIKSTLMEIARVQREEVPQLKAQDVHELVGCIGVQNLSLLAEALYRCALERKESRFSHYREEFPYRDDIDWLKWSVIEGDEMGMEVSFEPVPIESYPIRPAQRTRIPAPVQFTFKEVLNPSP